jgi:hypothetical protein
MSHARVAKLVVEQSASIVSHNFSDCFSVPSAYVRRIIRRRADRAGHFSPTLFADPAWDILLELFASTIEQQKHSIGSLQAAVPAPQTTTLRWISTLEKEGLLVRKGHPCDARRIFIALSAAGKKSMNNYFADQRTD